MTRPKRRAVWSRAGLIAAAIGSGAPAFAQSTNQTVQQQIPSREEVTPPAPTEVPRSTASVDSRSAIAASSCPFDTSDLTLTLDHVAFTRPDGSPLQPQIAATLATVMPPAGKQSIRAVCELRDAANAALRRDGWVASVQIPAQSIDTGTLTLQVVTARITEIRVRGNPGPYRRLLERRIAQLKAFDPLNEREAERTLLLAGDVPGLDIQLALRPAGTQPGDVIGDLNIVYRPFAILANVQNFNSRQIGRETGYVRGELYGLTGLADVTYLGLSSTADFREQRIVQVGHIMQVDGAGTSLGGRFTYAWSRPDLDTLDLRTNTLIAGFDVARPLVRTLATNLRLAGGFDFIDQKTRVSSGAGFTPLNLDKLRIAFARLSGDTLKRRANGTLAYSFRGGVEVRKGLSILDATPVSALNNGGALPSRIDGNSRAFVVRGDLDMTLGLGRYFSFAGSVRAQWANDPLLNYEEFSLGNLTIGRGYDPGSNSGDRAIGLRGELRADIPIKSRVQPQVFTYYDAVALTNLDNQATETDRHLRSYGGGFRLTLPNQLILEGTYAHPLDRALTIDKGPPTDRFLLSLIVQFRAGAR